VGAPTRSFLFGLRGLDGLVHLPAITLLIVVANRPAAERRGASLGLLASALMFGVTVGSPLGGRLVERGPQWVYSSGALFLRQRRGRV
jgi:predicted MFS family arabinose efflux permease